MNVRMYINVNLRIEEMSLLGVFSTGGTEDRRGPMCTLIWGGCVTLQEEVP